MPFDVSASFQRQRQGAFQRQSLCSEVASVNVASIAASACRIVFRRNALSHLTDEIQEIVSCTLTEF
jgi:hypothetical protein